MTKGYFEHLLDTIETAGYHAGGETLTESREWHELWQVMQHHPGWPGREQTIGELMDEAALIAEGWETMESAPLDGREIQVLHGPLRTTCRVRWTAGLKAWMRYALSPDPKPCPFEPTHWRPINS